MCPVTFSRVTTTGSTLPENVTVIEAGACASELSPVMTKCHSLSSQVWSVRAFAEMVVVVPPSPFSSQSRVPLRFQLPVPLSVDNLAAGAALGLAGYSVWVAPPLFAFCTFVVSVAGHQIGRTVANYIPRLRTDLLTGVAFVLMAGMVVAGVGDF